MRGAARAGEAAKGGALPRLPGSALGIEYPSSHQTNWFARGALRRRARCAASRQHRHRAISSTNM